MKQLYLLLLLALPAILLKAQPPTSLVLPRPQPAIKAAYLGSILYPGLKIGIERPYKATQIDKTKRWGIKSVSSERYLTANLGYYHHATFHDNFFLILEWQKRRQNANGWFMDLAPGLGYSRTFLGGTTYTVSDNGTVELKKLAGYNYALLAASYGGGYNWAMKKDKPLKAYGKISLLFLFPYNSFVYLRPTAELGLAYAVGRPLK